MDDLVYSTAAPITPASLLFFVTESNRIEGINRKPSAAELREHVELLAFPALAVEVIERFVGVIAPGKPLRREQDMNVRVGDHFPPYGGKHIEERLVDLLGRANRGDDPWEVHCAYETLHPFMDGNGRSGRAIWLWQMIRQRKAPWALSAGFLHLFYYQTLQHSGDRAAG